MSVDRLAKELLKTVKESDRRKTSGYDTTAKVLRVKDDTAWVHIPGGVDETPVRMSINAKAGDDVNIRVSGGSAWITGNATAPPTDDSVALDALEYAKNANKRQNKKVQSLQDEIEDITNGDIIEEIQRYCLANQNYIPTGQTFENIQYSAWSDDIPEYVTGKYFWHRVKYVHKNGDITFSDPWFDGGLQVSAEAKIAAGVAATAAETAQGIADQALGKAEGTEKYFWHDSSGAHISDTENRVDVGNSQTISSNGTVIMRNGKLVTSWTGTDSSDAALNFYDCSNASANTGDLMASYTRAGIILYANNKQSLSLTPSGMAVYKSDGSSTLASFTGSGISFANDVPFTIGNSNSYVKWVRENNVWKIKIAADEIELGGSDIGIFSGNHSYSGSDTPTNSNYPASSWTTNEERAKHIGDIYYKSSGEAYQYTGNGLQITFSSSSETESVSYDYVTIYFRYDGQIYKLPNVGGTSIAGASVYVPSSEFWLKWHSDSSVTKYGFAIDSITSVPVNFPTTATTASLPSGTAVELSGSSYPETSHPYDNSEDILWKYTGSTSYSWVRRKDTSIRLEATTIAWSSSGSSMTEAGALTCASGKIGGWEISNDVLQKSTAVTSGTSSTQRNVNMYAPSSPNPSSDAAFTIRHRSWNGSSYGSWSYDFYVRYDGYLYANNAHIVGGDIGGWTVDGSTRLTRTVTGHGTISLYSDGMSATYNNQTASYGYYGASISYGSWQTSYERNKIYAFSSDYGDFSPLSWGLSATANTTVSSLNETFMYNGRGRGVYVSNNDNFRPVTTKAMECGTASGMWTTVYAQNTTIQNSDRKVKDNIETLDFYKDLIMPLEPITYMWKDGDHRRKRMGFIAQDVSEVCKDINENLSLVTASYKSDGDTVDNDYFGEEVDDELLNWGMSSEQLIAPIVALIQEHETRLSELERRNA